MVEKLEMQTKNLTEENIRKIAELFPQCVTEVKSREREREREREIVKLAVDFDALRQELSDFIVEGSKERYQFTWPDKSKAKLLANTPTTMTLRPCREESVDFDNTKNLYIEGDNLEVLKILRETYLGKVKMIYIDPPYNTGNDFIYNDDFSMSSKEYNEVSGDYDEEGNRLVMNNSSNGRFHTDWLNMIYPRLILSKDLLSDDGVILISIDDNEYNNLFKLCCEIYGESNNIATFIVSSNSTKNNARHVSVSHEYVLCFAKNKNGLTKNWEVKKNNVDEFVKRANQLVSRNLPKEQIHEELLELVKYPRFYDFDHYTYADKKGIFRTGDSGGVKNGNLVSEIVHPITGKYCAKPQGGWRYNDEELKKKIENDEMEFGADETIIPCPKKYLHNHLTQIPKSVLFFDSQSSTKWLKKNKIPFEYPKSIDLIEYFVSMIPDNDLILDFFSGSATTAHAIMRLNKKDGGSRRFIMVQLPEPIESSQYETISKLGMDRICIAGKELKTNSDDMDIGFRVFKLDSSNMKDVFYGTEDTKNTTLDDFVDFVDNIKSDRTPEDLLFQVMLECPPLDLSSKIEIMEIDSSKVFIVDDGYLAACFDDSISEDVIMSIAKDIKPTYAVFRDGSMTDDAMLSNIEQIFKTYSPVTEIRVL